MVICYICRTKSLIVIKKCCQESATDENRWRFFITFAYHFVSGYPYRIATAD